MSQLLCGLRAVVVGGGGGIGSAIAKRFAAEGAALLLIDNQAAGMQATSAEIAAGGGAAICRLADITSEEQLTATAEMAGAMWPQIDILVNAAGISGRPLGDGPVHECTLAAWQRVLTVNLTGVYLTCRAFLPLLMAASTASIVNIASDDALVGPRPPHDTHAYIASKGGVIALTRAMAISYAARQIRVNAIAPGWVSTPMTTDLMQDPAVWQEVIDRHPLGRAGTPNDIAWAALYLAAPEAAFVTGVILPVEGGATAW